LALATNTCVFGEPDAPLNLQLSSEGSQIRQKGAHKKGAGIPFETVGTIRTTPDGKIQICSNFSPNHYNDQLVAGYSKTTASGACGPTCRITTGFQNGSRPPNRRRRSFALAREIPFVHGSEPNKFRLLAARSDGEDRRSAECQRCVPARPTELGELRIPAMSISHSDRLSGAGTFSRSFRSSSHARFAG